VVLVQPNTNIHLDYIHRIDQVIDLLLLTNQDSTSTSASTQSDDTSYTPSTSTSSTSSNDNPQRLKYKEEAIRMLQSLRIDLRQPQVSQHPPLSRRQ
jgi:hypothetical protein